MLTLESLSSLKVETYTLDHDLIRRNIEHLSASDGVSFPMDRHTKVYYASGKPFLWINRLGIYNHVDTLLGFLRTVSDCGLSIKSFRVGQIERDLERVRTLDFSAENDINKVMARLEYNLTRAFFRYSAGIYYGFVNPDHIYNNFEKYDVDSVTKRFRQLCDLRVKRPDEAFYTIAAGKIANDSLTFFLKEIQPSGVLYDLLVERLKSDGLSKATRSKIICNIERCRWKSKKLSSPDTYDKYVVVNIPSYCLRAVDNNNKNSLLTMRVGCGTLDHKTPLLVSRIMRMDVNPQWIVPKSIAKDIVYSHAYMHKMGMFIYDKKAGKMPPEASSYTKIMAGEQYIIQSGGPKNSLGRIIFRFDNNFSVFLHDTSSPWLLQRNKRAISHGCVRVEKPFELALFLLHEKDEELTDKLKYSMTMQLVNDNDSLVKRRVNKKKIVNTLSVKPSVPLFISYYTVYYDSAGKLADYDDIYGYDEPLIQKLAPITD